MMAMVKFRINLNQVMPCLTKSFKIIQKTILHCLLKDV